jgi:DNA-binding HxlR family transcriptional regulator
MTATREFTVKRDSVRAKLLFNMSENPEAPTSLRDLQAAIPVNPKALSVELVHLQKLGAVERVGRGLYIRHVGEKREFRQ